MSKFDPIESGHKAPTFKQEFVTLPAPEGVELPVQHTEVEVDNSHGKGNPKTVAATVAKKFVELVKSGETPSDAARRLHRKLSDLRMDEEFTRKAAAIIEGGYLPAEVRKALVRSGLNRRFVNGIDSDDPELRRDALTAAKMIAEDPEVGLKHTAPAVEIDLTVLGDILAKVETDEK